MFSGCQLLSANILAAKIQASRGGLMKQYPTMSHGASIKIYNSYILFYNELLGLTTGVCRRNRGKEKMQKLRLK